MAMRLSTYPRRPQPGLRACLAGKGRGAKRGGVGMWVTRGGFPNPSFCFTLSFPKLALQGDMMSEKKEIDLTFDEVMRTYKGDIEVLEKAIGTYFVGQKFGWRVMLLIHDRRTLKKYSDILGIDLMKELPEVGVYAERSLAWRAVQTIKSYWKAVRGEIQGIKSAMVG